MTLTNRLLTSNLPILLSVAANRIWVWGSASTEAARGQAHLHMLRLLNAEIIFGRVERTIWQWRSGKVQSELNLQTTMGFFLGVGGVGGEASFAHEEVCSWRNHSECADGILQRDRQWLQAFLLAPSRMPLVTCSIVPLAGSRIEP